MTRLSRTEIDTLLFMSYFGNDNELGQLTPQEHEEMEQHLRTHYFSNNTSYDGIRFVSRLVLSNLDGFEIGDNPSLDDKTYHLVFG